MAEQADPLAGRVAIVTGAARGIGRGVAGALGDAGADVVVSDLGGSAGGADYALAGAAELDEAVAEIAGRGGGRAIGVPCDVTQAAAAEALIGKARSEFGRIDLVVNNAGIVHMRPIGEISEQQWQRVHDVNVKGVFLVSQAALPALAETGGAIVNIASVAGKRGYANGTAYCSSKFAVVGFTQALANEAAPLGVRVNAVCPGILDTHMWSHHITAPERGGEAAYRGAVQAMVPLGRAQTPDDVAQAVLYLASAPNVTGIALNVAGGMEVW